MHWIRALDEELVSPLSEAAQEILGFPCRCELDLLNGYLRLVVTQALPPGADSHARQAVLARAKQLRPQFSNCGVDITRPKQAPYTSHLAAFPQSIRPFDITSAVTTFNLRLSHLFAFRDAEASLAARAERASHIVSFALGGVSTLTRLSLQEWDALALNPIRDGVAAIDLTRERYHLFAGLNWRFTDAAASFLRWLRSLSVDAKMLIFDTGTAGNAARWVLNLLQEYVPAGDLAGNIDIAIVGVVDGDDPRSVPGHWKGASRNGRSCEVMIEYLRIPNVLSEDFQRLVGHKRLSKLGYLLPLRDLGVARLVDDDGRVVQITGSDNIANVFQAYMTNAIGGPARLARTGREVLTEDVERAIVEQLLETAMTAEADQLHQAHAIGLLTAQDYAQILADMPKRYEDEFAAYPSHVWSFEAKKVRVGPDSRDAEWVAG